MGVERRRVGGWPCVRFKSRTGVLADLGNVEGFNSFTPKKVFDVHPIPFHFNQMTLDAPKSFPESSNFEVFPRDLELCPLRKQTYGSCSQPQTQDSSCSHSAAGGHRLSEILFKVLPLSLSLFEVSGLRAKLALLPLISALAIESLLCAFFRTSIVYILRPQN